MTERGIEANLEQIRAIQEMYSSKNKKEVQHFTGRLAARSRYFSGDFFQVIRYAKEWSPEYEEAFKNIQAYLL